MNPSKEIDDASDLKPEDWVESPKITDPTAVKPADWDEDAPQYILDESVEKPENWLEDEEATVPDPDAEVRSFAAEFKGSRELIEVIASVEARGVVRRR